MTADGPQRPLVSPGPSNRDPADEHRDAVQLLVMDVLRRFAGSIVDAALKSASVHELLASQAIMEKAYFSSVSNRLELVGVAEIAAMLGVTPRRVCQLDAEHKKFPPPLARLRCGSVWDAQAIREFDAKWARKVGRPKKETET